MSRPQLIDDDWTPSGADLKVERLIAAARTNLQFGATQFVRKRAMRDIETLKAMRSPQMIAYLRRHPEQA